jgi:hypothetical protein
VRRRNPIGDGTFAAAFLLLTCMEIARIDRLKDAAIGMLLVKRKLEESDESGDRKCDPV